MTTAPLKTFLSGCLCTAVRINKYVYRVTIADSRPVPMAAPAHVLSDGIRGPGQVTLA